MISFKEGLLGNTAGSDLNSLGHRCVELSQLNFKKYFLFVGDQISLGFDLPVEDTFPYMLSKRLGFDYYNLSVFNGGADALKYNLMFWAFKYKDNMPKAIFISVEFLNSFLISDSNLTFIDPANYADETIKDLSSYANINGFYNGRNFLLSQMINLNIKTPIYCLNIKDKTALFEDDVFIVNFEHETLDQKEIFRVLHDRYKANNQQVRP